MADKFCKQCEYFNPDAVLARPLFSGGLLRIQGACMRPVPTSSVFSLVHQVGSLPLEEPAILQRKKPGWIFSRDRCGPDGRYWEAKEGE